MQEKPEIVLYEWFKTDKRSVLLYYYFLVKNDPPPFFVQYTNYGKFGIFIRLSISILNLDYNNFLHRISNEISYRGVPFQKFRWGFLSFLLSLLLLSQAKVRSTPSPGPETAELNKNHIYQAKCLKCNEPIIPNLFNQTYKTKSNKPILPNQIYRTLK